MKKKLKKGIKIEIIRKDSAKDNFFVEVGGVWEVIGYNQYMGQKTYRISKILEDGNIMTTHCPIEKLDKMIENGEIQII